MFSGARSTVLVLALSALWAACVCGQDLQERDALCDEHSCYVIYFQHKTFLESWKSCKSRNGTLATVRKPEEAALIQQLFSAVDLRGRRLRVRVWIGLQRQQKQCSSTHPLHGYTWTTGDQDTEYTNWLREDSFGSCSSRSCVTMSYSTAHIDSHNNFKWVDSSCSQHMDAFLCQYSYKGMCPSLEAEGGGPVLYHTPFDLQSIQLSHVPLGSWASVRCPDSTMPDKMAWCIQGRNGKVGWSKAGSFCSKELPNWCGEDNGGCQHICYNTDTHYYCACRSGYHLEEDRHSCSPDDPCQRAPCEYGCRLSSDGSYLCTCSEGYVLAPDKHSCTDEDECLHDPCPQLCINMPGTFECHCNNGYQPDEAGDCTDIDECLNNPCEHACENIPGSYVCHCYIGFSPLPEDSSRCQDTDECQIPEICQQMCVNHVGGFDCHCEDGYFLRSDNYSCMPVPKSKVLLEATPSDFPLNIGITHFPVHNTQRWSDKDLLTDFTLPNQSKFPGPKGFTGTTREDTSTIVTQDRLTDERSSDWNEIDTVPMSFAPSPSSALSESTENPLTPAFSFYEVGEWLSIGPSTATSEEYAYQEGTLHQDLSKTTDFVEIEMFHGDNGKSLTAKEPISEAGATFSTPGWYTSLKSSPAQGLPKNNQQKDYTWLLVALLVPFLIIVVILLILGIVYFTRCGLKARNKSTADCYYWISGSESNTDNNKSIKSQV